MPKVLLHPWVKAISGKMGDVVFKRTPNGETIMTKRADMTKVKWSPAQEAHRKRLKPANSYARAAMADPKVSLIYQKRAARQKKRAYALAISDYFKGKNLLKKK
jgi:hypothetical protein